LSDPGLLLGPIAYAYDVYWDGQRIGSFGDLARGTWFTPRWQTFRIPPHRASPGAHTVALHTGYIGTTGRPRLPRLDPGDNRVGNLAALREAEAARNVQALLVPGQFVNVPGFNVDASYHPATEVGGDFFQLFPAAKESLLVVVGDVSGKGMKAA